MIGIEKRFGGAHALAGVSLEVDCGEVHGLLGANGSGKSTLIKVLAGYHLPDAGEMRWDGRLVNMPISAEEAKWRGLAFVHQDLGLITSLSVAENLMMRDLATRRGMHISWRRERQRVAEILGRYGLDISPRAVVSSLSSFERATIAVIRALEGIEAVSEGRGLLVLDEAMAFLADHERRQLQGIMGRLAASGTSVLLVTHDIDDAISMCDRVTVLRDGRTVGRVDADARLRDSVVEMIVGRAPSELPGDRHSAKPRARGDARHNTVRIVDLDAPGISCLSFGVGAGEIVGLTGLAGESFLRIPHILYGGEQAAAGTLTLDGTELPLEKASPSKSIAAGVVLIPGDRQHQGGVANLSVGDNVAVPRLDRYFRRGWINSRMLQADAQATLTAFDVRPPEAAALMSTLSGGNQQKTVVGKWLSLHPKLLLLEEPTVGVDVGSRRQIMAAIRGIASRRASVICASVDYAQVAELCDRVIVFSGGRAWAELEGNRVTREAIFEACLEAGRQVHE